MTRDEALELAVKAVDFCLSHFGRDKKYLEAMEVLTQMHFELEALPMFRVNDEMDVPQYCPDCGAVLQVVRPGKWQCVECER